MIISALSAPPLKSSLLTPRTAPVVWSRAGDEWADYVQRGYALGNCPSARASRDATSGALGRILDRILDPILETGRPGRILERGSSVVRSQFDIHHQFPELLELAVSRTICDQAEAILGGRPLLYQSHVNFKFGDVGGAYDWHSDYVYWRDHDGMLAPRAISIVIPLERHDIGNGGLQLLTGSHLRFYPSHLDRSREWGTSEILHDPEEGNDRHGLVPGELVNEFRAEWIEAPAMDLGDYLIMDANTWHFSGPNRSGSSRATLFVIVVCAETPFDERRRSYRPGYITCREGIELNHFLGRRVL